MAIYTVMKSILLALALTACVTEPSHLQSWPHDTNQRPPAGPAKTSECNVGLLPFERTLTVSDGDPLPAALVNELQDMHKADRRARFKRQIMPLCWTSSGTDPTIEANPQAGGLPVPVWKIPGSQTVRAQLPFEPGETVENILLDVYGDGTVDFTINVELASDLTATPATGVAVASTGVSVDNTPTAWTVVDVDAVGAVVTTQLVAGYLQLEIVLTGGGTHIFIGNVTLLLYR